MARGKISLKFASVFNSAACILLIVGVSVTWIKLSTPITARIALFRTCIDSIGKFIPGSDSDGCFDMDEKHTIALLTLLGVSPRTARDIFPAFSKLRWAYVAAIVIFGITGILTGIVSLAYAPKWIFVGPLAVSTIASTAIAIAQAIVWIYILVTIKDTSYGSGSKFDAGFIVTCIAVLMGLFSTAFMIFAFTSSCRNRNLLSEEKAEVEREMAKNRRSTSSSYV